DPDCAFDVEVMWMGSVPERVDNQDIESMQERHRTVGNAAAVGKIGEVPETKAGCLHAAVHEGDRGDVDSEQLEGRIDSMGFQELVVAVGRPSAEDVGKLAVDFVQGLF